MRHLSAFRFFQLIIIHGPLRYFLSSRCDRRTGARWEGEPGDAEKARGDAEKSVAAKFSLLIFTVLRSYAQKDSLVINIITQK